MSSPGESVSKLARAWPAVIFACFKAAPYSRWHRAGEVPSSRAAASQERFRRSRQNSAVRAGSRSLRISRRGSVREKGSAARGASWPEASFFRLGRLGRRREASTQLRCPTRRKPSLPEAASSHSLGLAATSHREAAIKSRAWAGRPACK